mgnify:CR=1 FL=1
MARTKNLQTIIQDFIDFIKLAQPDADTKPATVIRDILIDAPATQLSAYYDQLGLVSSQLAFKDLNGNDIDNYVKNFGISRKTAVSSAGVVLLTFNNIFADFAVNPGQLIYSSNGLSFSVLNGTTISSKNINYYKSVALKYKNDLDFLGITDIYAVEVSVQCTSPGTIGNISKYGVNRSNISNVNNATNILPFENGRDSETDSVLKNRFISSLNGASTGTNLGYSSAATSVLGVSDSIVIEPGDPLMTRDGTIVEIHDDGTREIISEGTGGKVDVLVLGKNPQENIESFIYRDKSNTNNASSNLNDVILGQIPQIDGKTINRKRFQSNQLGLFPLQPVDDVLEVTGSESGSNFLPKSVDEFGRISGNFEIIKDSGNFSGSPFAVDKFHWISNYISNFSEDKIKGQSFGQDKVNFTDVIKFNKITQNIPVTNENSTVLSDNRFIQLLHTPATSVSRVFNTNTGERYLIVNQNPDGGSNNSTGRVQINGKTLPRATDTLQVDYNWIVDYDNYYDFDGKVNTQNERTATDSIDWGYGALTTEDVKFVKDVSGNFFTAVSSNNISSLVAVNKYLFALSEIESGYPGSFVPRAFCQLTGVELVTEINSIYNQSEFYHTSLNDGFFVNNINNSCSVILPTDTNAPLGAKAYVKYNKSSLLENSTFNNNIITIPSNPDISSLSELRLEVIYIAKINELVANDVATLPTFRVGNGFNVNPNIPINSSSNCTITRESSKILQNVALDYYIDIECLSDISLLEAADIIEIFDISTNASYVAGCTVVINDGKYRVILDPAVGPVNLANVVILYNQKYKTQFQPALFINQPTYCNVVDWFYDNSVDKNYVVIGYNIISESNINFSIINELTGEVYSSYTDGYMSGGILYSLSTPFNNSMIVNKKIKVTKGSFKGEYTAFIVYATGLNLFVDEYIMKENISITRLKDNKDLSDTIEYTPGDGVIYFSKTTVNNGDKVILTMFKNNKLRSTPTKLGINLIDQNINNGVIQINGDSILKIEGVFTATSTGLKQNINELLRAKNLTGYKISDIKYLAKVNTVAATSEQIISINNVYDLKFCEIKTNIYSDLNSNLTLSDTEFNLNDSITNTLNNGLNSFVPTIGDRLKIIVYLLKENDNEILSFIRPGVLYTNKSFILVKNIKTLSGFKSTVNSRVVVTNLNQPAINSRYRSYYDYVAPKTNERIVIRYNYNKLINDVTKAVEKIRPINADVLAKEAKQISINVTMNIVIVSGSQNSINTIVQNLRDALINNINSDTLGGTIDSSDLISVAYSIDGIDRVRIIGFNKNEEVGQVLSITAQKDEYFVANNVIINVESR